MFIPIKVTEYKGDSNLSILLKEHSDFYFMVEERQCPEPYGLETWGFLCDQWGYKYHYSLPIFSTRYQDGYLNKNKRGDWYACFGGMGYNMLVITEEEMLRVLTELGYKE